MPEEEGFEIDAGLEGEDLSIEDILDAEDAPDEPAVEETKEAAETQAEAVEPEPQESAPPPPSEDKQFAESFKMLQAKERELQDMRRKLEEERSKLEPLRKYEELERRLKEEDAESALEAMGVKLDELNRAVVEGRGTHPNSPAQRKLEAKLEEMQSRYERLEQLEMQRVQREAQAEAAAAIAPEKFPLTAAVGDFGIETVLIKAQEHYQRTGQAPSYEQVIGEVEAELGSFVDRLMRSDAVKQRYLAQSPAGEAKKGPSPTLSNVAATTVSKRKPRTNQSELPEDREDAIEAILAELG